MVRDGLSRRAALARLAALAAAASGCTTPVRVDSTPPEAPREFRGAWIAAVSNIDWPSRPGLAVEAQQEEARNLVRVARSLGLNALILQVRPAADALYASPFEPWSEYLTGRAGARAAALLRPARLLDRGSASRGPGIARVVQPLSGAPFFGEVGARRAHIAKTHPQVVKAYGDSLWMDPGEPAAADRALAVILDVVRRYDVDGVHIDDYFYPYPVKGPTGRISRFPTTIHGAGTSLPAAALRAPIGAAPTWTRFSSVSTAKCATRTIACASA
jgi:uncharacterized lipoprotein YddW (UPF0748 family)